MLLLRSIVHMAWLTLTVIPWGLALVLISVLVRRTTLWWFAVGWFRVVIWGTRVILGIEVRVQGLENLPGLEHTPAVLLSKHQSTLETLLLPTLIAHPLAFVFKRELLRIPFFGWSMARLDMIHIDRSRRTEAWNKVAAQGKRLFGQGIWVIMFPEGTRAARGAQGTYKSGASRLAISAGVPIVPIAATSARCWPRKSFLLRPGVIDVSIGRPIPSVGRHADELMREVETWIEAEMRRLDPEAYADLPLAAQAG